MIVSWQGWIREGLWESQLFLIKTFSPYAPVFSLHLTLAQVREPCWGSLIGISLLLVGIPTPPPQALWFQFSLLCLVDIIQPLASSKDLLTSLVLCHLHAILFALMGIIHFQFITYTLVGVRREWRYTCV